MYLKNIIKLASGTLLSQVILLITIPIITRLYTPDEFGVYSLIISISMSLGLVLSLKYDQAIVKSKNKDEAKYLLLLSCLLALSFSLLGGLFISLNYFFELVDFNIGLECLVFIPALALMISLNQSFVAYRVKKKEFSRISLSRLSGSCSLVIIQILARKLFIFDGLLLGRFFSELVNITILCYTTKIDKLKFLKRAKLKKLFCVAIRHVNFPKYQAPTVFINSLSKNLPIIILGGLFSPAISGYYALAYRCLELPVGLVSSSTRDVFYQRASELNSKGSCFYHVYINTTLNLAKVFFPIFCTTIFLGEWIFSLVFGPSWGIAGNIASILVLWTYLTFINPPSIATYSILDMQNVQLIVESVALVLRFLSLILGYLFESYYIAIVCFSIVGIMSNIALISTVNVVLRKRSKEMEYI